MQSKTKTLSALAAQKQYNPIYLMSIYINQNAEQKLRADLKRNGNKINMGKSCIRFRTLEDLPVGVIAKAVSKPKPQDYIRFYEKARAKKQQLCFSR